MTRRTPREILIEQCDAGRDIKTRYGSRAAFDYVVSEKLPTFADAAAIHPEFARELPRFVSEVRRLFTPEELQAELGRVEREREEAQAAVPEEEEEEDDVFATESPQERQRFAIVRQLLTSPALGTS
jgi:hypothetical protein